MNRRTFIKRAAAAAVALPVFNATEKFLVRTLGAPEVPEPKPGKFITYPLFDNVAFQQHMQADFLFNSPWNTQLFGVPES